MTDTNVAETIRYKTHDAPLPSGNIRYHRSGEGRLPTILFLHGSGPGVSALSNWEGAIQRLGDRFDCVAPCWTTWASTGWTSSATRWTACSRSRWRWRSPTGSVG